MTPREKELADVAEVMHFKINRRFVWRILESAGINKSSFALETPVMAFNEGQRNMGLMILADIMDACPDKYLLMTREAKEQENERRATEQHEREQRRSNGELID